MKLYQYTEDPLHAVPVKIPNLGVHFVVVTESGTFRIKVTEEGVEVRESTYRNLVIKPSASNALSIGTEEP